MLKNFKIKHMPMKFVESVMMLKGKFYTVCLYSLSVPQPGIPMHLLVKIGFPKILQFLRRLILYQYIAFSLKIQSRKPLML